MLWFYINCKNIICLFHVFVDFFTCLMYVSWNIINVIIHVWMMIIFETKSAWRIGAKTSFSGMKLATTPDWSRSETTLRFFFFNSDVLTNVYTRYKIIKWNIYISASINFIHNFFIAAYSANICVVSYYKSHMKGDLKFILHLDLLKQWKEPRV